MFCTSCGKSLSEDAKFCPHCGAQISGGASSFSGVVQQPVAPTDTCVQDAPSTGFLVLSFFFPLVGLILYLVWRETLPLRAKSAGKGALIGVIVSAALTVILIIVYAFLIASLVSFPGHYI